MKPRLDELLVSRGLFETLHDAQAAVMAGEVVVGEHRADSAGVRVDPAVPVRVKESACPYVSRGGLKLAAALDAFAMDPRAKRCADLGCSTGGFTDCLLKRGAAHVAAIDVGRADFAWSLRSDARVSLFENTNVRGLDPASVGGPFELVVADLSFIGLPSVLADVRALLEDGGDFVTLVKPQFELPAFRVPAGGVVRDAGAHAEAVLSVVDAARAEGFSPCDLTFSPVTGRKGNIEFLLWLKSTGAPPCACATMGADEVRAVVAEAHESLGDGVG